MAASPLLSKALPARVGGEMTFAEPWEARAFAIIVQLAQAGHFSWSDWVDCFSKEVAAADAVEAAGELPRGYYAQWLDAAEKLLADKGFATRDQLAAEALRDRRGRWHTCAEMNEGKVPVTILTGFLGAGKTTLLNRILRERHGERIAVIENEFGETGVDNELLLGSGDEQIVEMNNGCICCTVRGDLVRILGELMQRRGANAVAFDRVIIETTGLADPAPVAQTFFVEEDIGAHYRLDAIVTVVDARHAGTQLDDCHEAQEQVAFADRILLSKTDLVGAADVQRLRTRLSRINPRAPIREMHFGDVPVAELLDIHGFSLDGVLDLDPGFLGEDQHAHDDAVQSFAFIGERPFDADRLQRFFRDAIAEHGKDLMRYKGIVAFDGLAHRVVIQGVHMMMGSDLGPAWAPGEVRASRLVFIGRDLPQADLLARLSQCLAD